MSVSKEELDLMEIFRDLGKICLTEAKCQKCADRYCLVGYSKDCAANCRIHNQTFVQNGFHEIPPSDIRGGYDEFDVLHGIAHLLVQCRSCKKDHYQDCVINIIRSALEVIEFGDSQEYEGDVISYLAKIQSVDPEKASVVAEEYSACKERKFIESQK